MTAVQLFMLTLPLGWKRATRCATAYRACMPCLQGMGALGIHMGDYDFGMETCYQTFHCIQSMHAVPTRNVGR